MTSLSPAHESLLDRFRRNVGSDNLTAFVPEVLADMDARYAFSSTRNVLSVLRRAYPDCAAFGAEFEKRRVIWQADAEKQTMTDRQAEKYLDWDFLQMFRHGWHDDMTPAERFALALYTMWEPARVDYTPMKVVQRTPRTFEDGVNYCVVHANSITIIFHAFKTAKALGDVVRRMPRHLERATRAWLADHPGTWLFQDEQGKPWQEQRLAALVRAPFQRLLGMDVGISMIRHAYATHFNRDAPTLSDMKETANAMMHGVMMNQAYRFAHGATSGQT